MSFKERVYPNPSSIVYLWGRRWLKCFVRWTYVEIYFFFLLFISICFPFRSKFFYITSLNYLTGFVIQSRLKFHPWFVVRHLLFMTIRSVVFYSFINVCNFDNFRLQGFFLVVARTEQACWRQIIPRKGTILKELECFTVCNRIRNKLYINALDVFVRVNLNKQTSTVLNASVSAGLGWYAESERCESGP